MFVEEPFFVAEAFFGEEPSQAVDAITNDGATRTKEKGGRRFIKVSGGLTNSVYLPRGNV